MMSQGQAPRTLSNQHCQTVTTPAWLHPGAAAWPGLAQILGSRRSAPSCHRPRVVVAQQEPGANTSIYHSFFYSNSSRNHTKPAPSSPRQCQASPPSTPQARRLTPHQTPPGALRLTPRHVQHRLGLAPARHRHGRRQAARRHRAADGRTVGRASRARHLRARDAG